MRLINTKSPYEFEEFITVPHRRYAILSHRWIDGQEISYKDFRKRTDEIHHLAGYRKIKDFCDFAQQRGYDWAWVDTCCIDKRSSADLTEAINSMYMWYRMAGECHVLLHDYRQTLRRCEWFSRGWTLQELLAPDTVVFCTAEWEVIGHKHNHQNCPCEKPDARKPLGEDLVPMLAKCTKIPAQFLSKKRSSAEASVAERMSWASMRVTTRKEDEAYCLLGLFDINMALYYGEGANAFQRLQKKILQISEDTSIFCFIPLDRDNKLLAASPRDFEESHGVEVGHLSSSEPYRETNKGLRIRSPAGSGLVIFSKSSGSYSPNTPTRVVRRIDLGCEGPVLDDYSKVSKQRGPQYLILSSISGGQQERLTWVHSSTQWDDETQGSSLFYVRFR